MKERKYFNFAQRWKIEQSGNIRLLQRRKRKGFFFTVATLLLIVLFASPWIVQVALDDRLGKIEARVLDYQDVAVVLQDIDLQQGEIERIESFLKMTEEKMKNPRIIRTQIEELLPPGTSITSFSLEADKSVQMEVVVPGPVDLVKFWINFRDSGLFVDFDMQTVSLKDEVQNLNLTLKMK